MVVIGRTGTHQQWDLPSRGPSSKLKHLHTATYCRMLLDLFMWAAQRTVIDLVLHPLGRADARAALRPLPPPMHEGVCERDKPQGRKCSSSGYSAMGLCAGWALGLTYSGGAMQRPAP